MNKHTSKQTNPGLGPGLFPFHTKLARSISCGISNIFRAAMQQYSEFKACLLAIFYIFHALPSLFYQGAKAVAQ